MAKDIYQPFRNNLKPVLGGDIAVTHQDQKPDGGLQKSMGAPVTEVATFYFDGAPPDDAYESCKKFIDICEKDGGAKVYGWSYGITQEEIEREGVKGYGAVLTIGWENVEAHMVSMSSLLQRCVGLCDACAYLPLGLPDDAVFQG
jgi:hypothetical protein